MIHTNTYHENTHHVSPASAEHYHPTPGNHRLKETIGNPDASLAASENPVTHIEPPEEQKLYTKSSDRPRFGIGEDEQPFIVEAAREKNRFEPIIAMHTMLEQSFITAACFASLHLQRIPFAPSLQVKSYQSPFGLYDPSHFVTLLLRGIEHGSPSFYASVAVIDLDIPWQNIGLFIGNGIRRKAKDAIMAAQGQAQPRENQSPALTIAFINTGINEQLTPGRLREATSIQSSSGPAIASGVGPYGPSCLSPPSRTASRIEVTPLGTPVEAHSSTTPTSFGLEVLSRCSKDAQRYGKFELVSHDSHETPQDKVHLEE